MNSRRVHKLMRGRFPEWEPEAWSLLCDCDGSDESGKIEAFLNGVFNDDRVLVECHRTTGGFYTHKEAAEYISKNLGKFSARIANREFTHIAVVAKNGVAAVGAVDAQQIAAADV